MQNGELTLESQWTSAIVTSICVKNIKTVLCHFKRFALYNIGDGIYHRYSVEPIVLLNIYMYFIEKERENGHLPLIYKLCIKSAYFETRFWSCVLCHGGTCWSGDKKCHIELDFSKIDVWTNFFIFYKYNSISIESSSMEKFINHLCITSIKCKHENLLVSLVFGFGLDTCLV